MSRRAHWNEDGFLPLCGLFQKKAMLSEYRQSGPVSSLCWKGIRTVYGFQANQCVPGPPEWLLILSALVSSPGVGVGKHVSSFLSINDTPRLDTGILAFRIKMVQDRQGNCKSSTFVLLGNDLTGCDRTRCHSAKLPLRYPNTIRFWSV